ncbi:phosphoribosylamine--glycine ligase [Hazenella coriacea]|uniref:Phosphoribosylamine--glycine ligase n=1 Tax=Hazenella coriacea TaxID=1179467 RepID=A0A4V2UUS1_9BACL|nr:phosphoribosylamine--glycine ligase [Hazenella coriacea]TCS92790.1 phosphoribosylamine--glycine ligase [Hazenella coriacea]
MRILVVGSGGREHAIIWKLSQSKKVSTIFCAPGNGGIRQLATCVPIEATDLEGLVSFAKEKKIDLTVVGPEIPLLEGIVDRFQQEGLAIFGPCKKAAQIEGSKRFAKEMMKKYKIPTAKFRSFTNPDKAKSYINKQGAPIVIKADGLAAGKGVVVAGTIEEAEEAISDAMEKQVFGDAGNTVVIEEFLQGQEISLMAFVDGSTYKPMVVAQDHKPAFDGDEGPNTGGMGTYSPVPQIPEAVVHEAIQTILEPMIHAFQQEKIHYQGILYVGLMVTSDGPKVIEFNARFGDPETQVVLPRLQTDLLEILLAVTEGRLDEQEVHWVEEAAVCVVMASGGYPGAYESGYIISGLPRKRKDSVCFHAGTKKEGSNILTAGGRVLAVTGLGQDLMEAREKAYQLVKQIHFSHVYYRTDIGLKALTTVDES